jgi:hypothetical protein
VKINYSALPLLLCLPLTGCFGLGKSDDAKSPVILALEARARASGADPQSSLARSSGEVTYLRLNSLFPNGNLNRDNFTLLGGTGLDRAFGQMQRPYSALAQTALRGKSADLCNSQLTQAGSDKSAIFQKNVLVDGESLPTDPAILAGFTAARNVWLNLYAADSPEVQELAGLYRTTLAASTGATATLEAERAVCMTALLAPQFWIGGSTPSDVVRKIALEIGRRLPTFKELQSYSSKPGDFVTLVQKEPGYLAALHGWHEEWLGLRPFVSKVDPRPDFATLGLNGTSGATLLSGLEYSVETGQTMVPAGTRFSPANQMGFSGESCANADQDFDPDTKYFTWENQDTTVPSGKWNFVGGWVRADSTADFIANYLGSSLLRATYPDLTPTQIFNDACIAPGTNGNTVAGWYACGGLLALSPDSKTQLQGAETYFDTQAAAANAAGKSPSFFVTSKASLQARKYNNDYVYYRTQLVDIRAAGDHFTDGYLGYFNPTQHSFPIPMTLKMDATKRRFRRFAPSGEQNGYSTVQLWHSGSSARVCNSMSRFVSSCFYRPDSTGATQAVAPSQWNATMSKFGADASNWVLGSFGHPAALKSFRCGVPSYAAIAANGTEDQMYPRATLGQPMNTLAQVRVASAPATHPEGQAIERLFNDLHGEPYYLIDYVITNNRPYSEILTADYTCGRGELERYYKSQGYYLPVDVTQFESIQAGQTCSSDPSLPLKKFTLTTPIPTGLLKLSTGGYQGGTQSSFIGGAVQPKASSGILTMPGFLGPVSPKMRTIASRYFTRLMCGEPNIYAPKGSQDDLHAKYISQSKLHPDHLRAECRQCHINLDPLAAALSPSFVQNEGDSPREALGEMQAITSGQSPVAFFGVRGGGPKGTGALLGTEVSGVRAVASVLAGSDQFNGCVVQKVFENVFGRQIGFADIALLNGMTTAFKSHQNYNRLIHDMVETPDYQRRN